MRVRRVVRTVGETGDPGSASRAACPTISSLWVTRTEEHKDRAHACHAAHASDRKIHGEHVYPFRGTTERESAPERTHAFPGSRGFRLSSNRFNFPRKNFDGAPRETIQTLWECVSGKRMSQVAPCSVDFYWNIHVFVVPRTLP
nr:PREDICTED: uncharacterized protein LOC105663356 [Megachile rotundata]